MHFLVSKNQIVRLYSRFLNLDRQGRGYLDREDFLRIPELAINPLGDRIVDAFFTESWITIDLRSHGHRKLAASAMTIRVIEHTMNTTTIASTFVNLFVSSLTSVPPTRPKLMASIVEPTNFVVRLLCLLSFKTNLDRYVSVAFSMYDLNKNNFITRDEFKFILNMVSLHGMSITSLFEIGWYLRRWLEQAKDVI